MCSSFFCLIFSFSFSATTSGWLAGRSFVLCKLDRQTAAGVLFDERILLKASFSSSSLNRDKQDIKGTIIGAARGQRHVSPPALPVRLSVYIVHLLHNLSFKSVQSLAKVLVTKSLTPVFSLPYMKKMLFGYTW